MNIASLELCRELYELSGWKSSLTWGAYNSFDETLEHLIVDSEAGELGHDMWRDTYAYDLGYLLRKLPDTVMVKKVFSDVYQCSLRGQEWLQSNTPEDAVAKLAIELFKQGILIKEVKR